ncbi:MAG: TlpA disulfide reductase family protein [Thiohalomonadales bacterium]
MIPTLAHFRGGLNAAINIVFFFIVTSVFASEQKSSFQLELEIKNTNIAFTVYPGLDKSNNDLILWLPSDYGLPDSVFNLAEILSNKLSKNEVWIADLFGSLFLPTQASSIYRVPDDILYELINKVHLKTKKRIFIISNDKGAYLAMRASYYWLQHSLNSEQLGGLILLSPNLFTKTPEPGYDAEYYPITYAVNAPIFILQPENSPKRWQLATLQQHLITANAIPYISILPKIRDRFFFRPDATKDEQRASQKLAATIQTSIHYLKSEKITNYPIPPKLKSNTKNLLTKKQTTLRKYTKNPTPPALVLNTLSNQQTSLRSYRGNVVIVNFWASWCPPCVHEMPSMEKLYQRYSKSGLQILAVNMAEDKQTIRNFLQNRVNVSFPILLDLDGKALLDWQVFAFPTSFVIDKQGKIRYALFGSILWNTPEVIEIIEELLSEPTNIK